jgi:hypothetical protein
VASPLWLARPLAGRYIGPDPARRPVERKRAVKTLSPIIIATLLAAGLGAAQAEEPAEIPVVHLEMTLVRGVFALQNFAIEDGPPPATDAVALTEGVVRYVVMDHSGRPMSEGLMADPARVPHETVHGDGSTHSETTVSDSVRVQMTLPYDRAMHQIRFAKIVSVSDSAGVQMTRTQSMGAVYVELHGDED